MINDEIDNIFVEDTNDYETEGEYIEIHSLAVDTDFDDIGFEPIVEESQYDDENIYGY